MTDDPQASPTDIDNHGQSMTRRSSIAPQDTRSPRTLTDRVVKSKELAGYPATHALRPIVAGRVRYAAHRSYGIARVASDALPSGKILGCVVGRLRNFD
jgi:hypothetical protein